MARIGEMRNASKILIEKPARKRQFAGPRSRWKRILGLEGRKV
jgi:hypothetical protein